MKVMSLKDLLAWRRRQAEYRDEFLVEVRGTLKSLLARSIEYEPFQHGDFFGQLRFELNSVAIEMGDPLASERRLRRNKKIPSKTRLWVYRRDKFTCQECGWKSPRQEIVRRDEARGGRWLTIDHIIPLAEGGPNWRQNMRTLCSICNPIKGKQLPDDEDVAA